jgi:hypothetical protein
MESGIECYAVFDDLSEKYVGIYGFYSGEIYDE